MERARHAHQQFVERGKFPACPPALFGVLFEDTRYRALDGRRVDVVVYPCDNLLLLRFQTIKLS